MSFPGSSDPKSNRLAMPALSDFLILDVSRVLAGPYCGQLFADHGAEVIKIESLDGDPSRTWPLKVHGVSTAFLSVNRNKKSITLNLASADGRALFYRLIAKADVLIHNYLPTTAAKLGISDEELERINPNLIQVSISGYGANGPKNAKPGYDTMVTAYSGIMSLTGERGGPLVKPGISAIDLATGMLAYAGAVTALLARGKHGVRGQRVEASLLETAVSLLGVHAINWLVGGQVDEPEGADYGPIVPYGRYRCEDGFLMVGAPNQKAWLKLCAALATPELQNNPLYSTTEARHANSDVLRGDLETILSRRTVSEWVDIFDEAAIPNAPVNRINQVFADPQVHANDMVIDVPTEDGDTIPLLGFPIKLSRSGGVIGTAPPLLGAHNAEVFARHLQLTDVDVAALREAGTI